MSEAAVRNEPLRLIESVGKVLSLIHRKYGRKLFMSKFLVKADGRNLANKYFRLRRNGHAGKLRNAAGLLPDDFCI